MAHKFFVQKLEPCVSNWSADQQIGEMFYTLVSFYVAYCIIAFLWYWLLVLYLDFVAPLHFLYVWISGVKIVLF